MEKNKYHILVVDDDDKIKELIKQFLEEKGLIVSTASNATEAKEKIAFFNFNLIVLDVMMPGQTGYELTKELKSSKNIPSKVPKLCVTCCQLCDTIVIFDFPFAQVSNFSITCG